MLSVKVIQCSHSVSSIIASRMLQLRRSNVKEMILKYKQFSERKTLITPSRLLLGGTFVFKADLSVSEVVSETQISPSLLVEKPRGVLVGLAGLGVWLLDTLRLMVHCLRTILVFSPLLLSSPLLLLPPTLRPSSLLLDLLGQGFNGKWIKPCS